MAVKSFRPKNCNTAPKEVFNQTKRGGPKWDKKVRRTRGRTEKTLGLTHHVSFGEFFGPSSVRF